MQPMATSDRQAREPARNGEAAAPAAAAAHAVPGSHPWGGTSLQQLRSALQQFAAERDWGQYHTPRNLVLALVGAGAGARVMALLLLLTGCVIRR